MEKLKYEKSQIVFVHLLLTYAAGILLSYHFRTSQLLHVMIIACGLIFLGIATIAVFYRQLRLYKNKWMTGTMVYLFSFCCGGLICLLNDSRLASDYYASKEADYLKVTVTDEPQVKNGMLRFKAEVTERYKDNGDIKLRAEGKLLVMVHLDSSSTRLPAYGNELIIPFRFSEIEPPYNPGEFDYKSWLAAKDIHNRVFLKQHEIVTLAERKGNPLIAYALTLRSKQVAYYRSILKNDDAFAMASTLILGYRADLSEDTLAVYSKTGTIHALSVSGMHVGLIYLVLDWILFFLWRSKLMKVLKVGIILTAIWYYTLLTGLSPSVLRSAIMLSAFVFAKLLDRESNGYNVLAFAAFCLLLYDPYLIWDVGFQLSFLAVFGLICLQPLIQSWWPVEHKWVSRIWSALAMSFSAQLTTFPLSIYYFHQFPLYFLISNLFIIIPSALIMYLGIIILVFRLSFLASVFEWMIHFMNKGLDYISMLPFSNLTGIWIDKTELILICTSLLLMIFMLKTKNKWMLFGSICCLLLLQLKSVYSNLQLSHQKKIIIFKLRKNYAAAFISAGKAIVFTNLNAGEKTFRYSVKPALDLYQIEQVTFINGDKYMVTPYFRINGDEILFYNYLLRIDDLKKRIATQIDL
ncbi:ComEC/Rec2 family competence protein [Pedobacter frigoris]|uniref:ComEC family competence protein n=1 Tax=Pedobacter frigoris TaxID=2571272 RepID=A0A4U1CHT4_9SPHI|nr:ComEC/Rec2 family competence protein [Pedobacter frigoris]TKC05991.1 ComEC family competence protein [Pedobacter frigoris]